MPTPFPGMDPFLEHPEIFQNLHGNFMTHLQDSIQLRLPEPYYVSTNRRTWIEMSERFVEPDTNVDYDESRTASSGSTSSGTAVLERTTAPIVIRVERGAPEHDEFREHYLEIYHGRRPSQRLVASVELLSPSNKRGGSQGRELYLKKQEEMLKGQVHLIEIDLLRGGEHATSIPIEILRQRVPVYDYHVCIHRYDRPLEYLINPFLMQESLPTIDIPLLPEHGTIPVPLQPAFDRCYNGGPYSREINYRTERPVSPLTPEQNAWVRQALGIPPGLN